MHIYALWQYTHIGRRERSGGGTSRQEDLTPVIARRQRQITTAGLVPAWLWRLRIPPGHTGPAARVQSCLTRAGHRPVVWPHEIPDSGISHRNTGSSPRSGTEAGDIPPVFAALEHAAGDFTTLGKNPLLGGSSPPSDTFSNFFFKKVFDGRDDGGPDGGQVGRPDAGSAGRGIFAEGHVADVVVRLHLSSRLRRCDVIRGLVGEFGVDTGGPAADTVDVGAEFGEFAGIGVDDPAVRVPGFLPSGDASLVQPFANGAGGHAEFGREQWQPPFVVSPVRRRGGRAGAGAGG